MSKATKDTVELTREEAILIKVCAVKIMESIIDEYKEFKDEYDADEKALKVLEERSIMLDKIVNKINKALDKK